MSLFDPTIEHIHGDGDEDDADTGDGAGKKQDGEDADCKPEADNGREHVTNKPRDADTSPVTRSKVPPLPFSTAASVSNAQADRHDS
jgi:hypothetical protein